MWLSHPGRDPGVGCRIVDQRGSRSPPCTVTTSKHEHFVSIRARVSLVPAAIWHWRHSCAPGSFEAGHVGRVDGTSCDGVVEIVQRQRQASAVVNLCQVVKDFFQNKMIFYFGYFDPVFFFLIIQINIFRGDLSDVSAKTVALVSGSRFC